MIRYNPRKPFTLVIGGSKIKDKIGALENLLPKADKLLIGGGAAYTFLKAKGFKIGNSLFDEEHFDWVKSALSSFGEKILLPLDHIVSSEENSFSTVSGDIPDGMCGFDIGSETSRIYSSEIGGNGFGTIFWNGPMGMFEVRQFAGGSMIEGLKANEEKLSSFVEKSPILVALLNPHIGYLKASEIYKESMTTNKSIRELVIEKGLMTGEELDNALSKKNILGSK